MMLLITKIEVTYLSLRNLKNSYIKILTRDPRRSSKEMLKSLPRAREEKNPG